jgi:hypothetical protein
MVRSVFFSFFTLVNIFRREVILPFCILFLFGLMSCRLNDNEIKGTIGCHADCSSSPGSGDGSGNPADPIVGLTASKLVFLIEPTNAAVNSTMSEVQVEVKSSSNVHVLTNQVVVSLSIHSDTSYGLARLGGTLSATTVNGVARFPNLMINKSFDNFQLGASASGLKPAVSVPFNVVGSATQIYRSVGPGRNSYLADGASNPMTISNSVATFANPLPDDVGLGDAIQYDSSGGGNGSGVGSVDRIVFVHQRVSSNQYLVKRADGSSADATVGDLDWSACRAYTNLWNAIGNSGGGTENDIIDFMVRDFDSFSNSGGEDLTVANKIWNVVLYGDGVQGNPIYVWNWTTDGLRYLRLFTPVWPSEVGVSQRHFGQWTEKAFRLGVPTVGGDGNRLSVKTNTVTVDGLQIMVDDDGGSISGLYIESIGSSVVSNNILRKIDSVSWGSGIYLGSTGGIGKIFNNLIYGFDVFYSIRVNAASSTQYIYNNSGFDHTNGIRSENGTVIAKNNLMKGSSNNQNYSGIFGMGSNYNISDDTTVPGGANDRASSPIGFFSELFDDFRLSLTGNSAVNGGTSLASDSFLPFTSDIRSYLRGLGNAWDIGAFEMAESIFGDDLAAEFSQGQLSSSVEVDGAGSLRLRAIPASERELQVPDSSFDMSGLVALWHFNESSGQIMDASGYLHHSIASGGTPTYGQSGVLNSAMTFESTSSEFIDFGQLPEIEQVSRMSLVAWVKRSSSGSKVLIGGHEPSGAYDSIFLELWDDGKLNAIVTDSSYYYGGSRALNDTQWHHIAMVFDGTLTGDSNRLKAFIDGVQVPLVFSGGGSLPSLTPDLSTNFMIGTNNEGSFSDGSVDEVSVWSRALSAVEMRTLYERQKGSYKSEGSEFLSRIFDSGALDGRWGSAELMLAEPVGKEISRIDNESSSYGAGLSGNGLMGLWHLNDKKWGSLVDSSGRGHDGTIMGNLVYGQTGPFDLGLGFNDVDGQAVTVPAHADLEPDNLTISFWFQRNGIQNDYAQMVTKGCCIMWSGDNWSYSFEWDTDNGGTEYSFGVNSTIGGYFLVKSPHIPDQTWVHTVGTYNDATKTVELYVNGVSAGTMLMPGSRVKDPADELAFGQYGGGPGGAFKGKLDEIAIWNRVLSPGEIQSLYRRGKAQVYYQVRSCLLPDCSDSTFVGPQGKTSTYFSEQLNGSSRNPLFDLLPLNLKGRYFQYRLILETSDSLITPEVKSVKIEHLN